MADSLFGDTGIFSILGFAFAFLFGWWPFLIVLGAFRVGGNILRVMLFIWGMLAVGRVTLFLLSIPVMLPLFPDPLNTILFFLTGPVLASLYFGIKRWKKQQFANKTGVIKTVEQLQEVSPVEFEDMVVDLYRGLGHKATRTGQTGDHGVDVVVHARNGEKWIVQCKRWRGRVGEPVVRDFYGTLNHEKAHQGAIITSGKFSRAAREWAKGKPIYLYDGEEFLKAWRKLQKLKDKRENDR